MKNRTEDSNWRIFSGMKESLQIVLIYVIFGSLWILFSDSLLESFVSNPSLLITISKLKGWIYVLVTGILLFNLIHKEISQIQKLNHEILYKNEELMGSNEEIRALYEEMAASEEALHQSFDELQLYRQGLEEKVESRTRDLTDLNHQLVGTNDELISALDRLKKTQYQLLQSEKTAAFANMVTGIAHEISGPIGICVTSVSYVLKETEEMESKLRGGALSQTEYEEFISECKAFIQATARNLERADLLISGFKHISIDQITEEKRVFQVKAYLDELILSLNPLFKDTFHHVRVVCRESMFLDSYPGYLTQIISNFISNSLRYGFEDGRKGNIDIIVDQKDDFVILTYQDDGVGISAVTLEKIFDPFFTTKRGSEGGTGLGLYLVYNIVTQKLGGEITCTSKPESGVTFVVKFPYNDDATTQKIST